MVGGVLALILVATTGTGAIVYGGYKSVKVPTTSTVAPMPTGPGTLHYHQRPGRAPVPHRHR